MPFISPKILVWARETAGLSLEEAAEAISLDAARGKTGAERLAEFEAGTGGEISRPLLLRISQQYRRPLLIFYMSEPPRKGDRGRDFRTLPTKETPVIEPLLDALLRDIKVRQGLVREVLEDEEATPLTFINSVSMREGPSAVAQKISEVLNFKLSKFRGERNYTEAFRYLRHCMERSGIFTLLAGDLGSPHSKISVERFRGFAIADPIAPFVVINDGDVISARSFTALHEVTHLFLGATGVSGGSPEESIERFCNEVAGTILLPAEELSELQLLQSLPFVDVVDRVKAFAETRKLSRSMVAYTLLQADYIEQGLWSELNRQFAQDRQELNAKKKDQDGSKGGPNYYVVRRHRVGEAILHLVDRSMNSGSLSPIKASKILGVKPRNVSNVLNKTSFGRS